MEDPSFDWAPPKDKDKVYDPDLEAMCSTLKARVLTFPSKDLPAKYNSFVLHLIEGYQQSLLDQRAAKAASRGQIDLEMTSSFDDTRVPKETRVDKDTTTKKPKDNAFNRRWPASPSRAMTRLSRKLLTVNTNPELEPLSSTNVAEPQASPGEHRGALNPVPRSRTGDSQHTSGSDLSSIIGDLLPDEVEEVYPEDRKHQKPVAVHLACWLANRIGGEPAAVLPEIAEILSAYGEAHFDSLEWTRRDSNMESLTRSPTLSKFNGTDDSGRPPVQRKNKSEERASAQSLDPKLKRLYRGFSFIPGDDSKLSQAIQSLSTHVATAEDVADGGRGKLGLKLTSASNTRPLNTSATAESSARSSEESEFFGRENSNRSIMTAINTGSYRGSSVPVRVRSSSNDTVKKVGPVSKKDSLAAAAARVAGSIPGNMSTHTKTGAAERLSGL